MKCRLVITGAMSTNGYTNDMFISVEKYIIVIKTKNLFLL